MDIKQEAIKVYLEEGIMLHGFYQQSHAAIGRNAFFDLFAKNKLLVCNKNNGEYNELEHCFYYYAYQVKDFTLQYAHKPLGGRHYLYTC